MISVVLIEPETPGNIGAIARVMKNFGFMELTLVNPKCDHMESECRNRAKHAQDIIENIKVIENFKDLEFDYLVGTTAKVGTDYNILRTPVNAREFAIKIKDLLKNESGIRIGLLIGRESTGLLNEEIGKCDFTLTIPASNKYETLNISHAVGIILYELFLVCRENNIDCEKETGIVDQVSHIQPIGKAEKEQIGKMFDEIFDNLEWQTNEKRETQELLWRRIIGKAMISNRESFSVMGLLRKLIQRLEK